MQACFMIHIAYRKKGFGNRVDGHLTSNESTGAMYMVIRIGIAGRFTL
jgi:hypothetical protein